MCDFMLILRASVITAPLNFYCGFVIPFKIHIGSISLQRAAMVFQIHCRKKRVRRITSSTDEIGTYSIFIFARTFAPMLHIVSLDTGER